MKTAALATIVAGSNGEEVAYYLIQGGIEELKRFGTLVTENDATDDVQAFKMSDADNDMKAGQWEVCILDDSKGNAWYEQAAEETDFLSARIIANGLNEKFRKECEKESSASALENVGFLARLIDAKLIQETAKKYDGDGDQGDLYGETCGIVRAGLSHLIEHAQSDVVTTSEAFSYWRDYIAEQIASDFDQMDETGNAEKLAAIVRNWPILAQDIKQHAPTVSMIEGRANEFSDEAAHFTAEASRYEQLAKDRAEEAKRYGDMEKEANAAAEIIRSIAW